MRIAAKPMNKNRVCEMNIFSFDVENQNPLQRYEKKMKVTKKLVIKLLLI